MDEVEAATVALRGARAQSSNFAVNRDEEFEVKIFVSPQGQSVTGISVYLSFIASFIDSYWMTLETGDFTYETEYLEPLSWPPTEISRRSNVFPHLGSIDAPLLLIHGDADPICPLSHAVVAYRALAVQGHPVGLVVYPGEGHGFNRPENQRDCAQRLLAFFMEYLPVSGH